MIYKNKNKSRLYSGQIMITHVNIILLVMPQHA